ncbi:NAD-dependent 4,6-dehydratase LegB [uncultured Thalassospira sp.]|uniref:NAD-dependent 4,6-dehydratase LegB n=1 Tax=uncultured Thalassospira sp. TaxID=404382 RepID=UPI00258344D6|nr:NAD-dependent 4,6-dehydratase LegB [uncultured Thalassospira sp.]
MTNVFVTGADGFIGSHLVELLVRNGYRVKALSYYNAFGRSGWLDNVSADIRSEIELVSGDICDAAAMTEYTKGQDAILHLAALIGIPYSYVAANSYVNTNIAGTINLLQAARHHQIQRFVHTSTSEVYGTARFVPITEEHPLQPQSPYSASKISADSMAESFHRSFGLPLVILRPFNTYGPRQSTRAVIPTIITQLASGQREIKLGATHPTRDFNYVEDTARAFVAALQADAAIGHTVNASSNFEISVGDTAATIADIMNVDMKILSDDVRQRPAKSEVERLWGCNKKAEKLLGWRPEFGGEDGLRRGLEKTVEWFSDPVNLAMFKADGYGI